MKFALMVYQTAEALEQRDGGQALAAGLAYVEALKAAGVFLAGGGLEAPSKSATVSVREGRREVQDGPYAESKEYLAGFGFIEVEGWEEALEWAARHPAAARSRVEVRPLLGSRLALAGAA